MAETTEGFWEGKPKAQRKRRRRWPWVVGGVALVLVLLVALAPTIAGWVAPGYVASAINSNISGTAKVEGLSLSWFGSQEVGPVVIRDAAGTEVARVKATVGTSLLGLIGGLDLGEVKVSGSAHLVREKDGTLSTAKVFTPRTPAPPTASPATRLPEGLRATLIVENFEATFDDRAGDTLVQGSIKGRGGFAVGGPATLDLTAETRYGPKTPASPAALTSPGGTVTMTASVDGLTTAGGLLTPGAATVDARVSAADIAPPMAGALAGLGGALTGVFGPAVSLTLTAAGSAKDATVTMVMKSPGASADAAIRYAQGPGGAVVSVAGPATLRFGTAGIVGLAPGLAAVLESRRDEIEVTQWPEVSVTLASLRLPLPRGGTPLDLRGAALSARVTATPAAGWVAVGGAGQPKQDFRVEPVSLSLVGDLDGAVKAEGGASFIVGGQPAGTLAVSMAAARLLNERGGLRGGLPGTLSGSVALTKVTTSLARPFLEGAGVDLATDVGPTLDLTLAARTIGEGDAAKTDLSLNAESANLRVVAFASAAGTTIASRDRGAEIRAADLGPLLERFGASSGLIVDKGGAVVVSIPAFQADTARIAAGDYRGLSLGLKIAAPGAGGMVALRPGEAPQAWATAPMTMTVETSDLAAGIRVAAGTSVTLGGQSAGSLEAGIAAAGLLDAQGRLLPVPGSLDGTVSLRGASTAVAQPWVQAAGLDLPMDLGPRLDVHLVAKGRAGPGTAAPTTDLDLTATTDKLTSSVALTMDAAGVRGRDQAGRPAVDLALRDAGGAAGRMLAGVHIGPEGGVRVQVTGLNLPLDAGRPRLDRASLAATVALTGFSADVPAATAQEHMEVARLDAAATLAPGVPARFTLTSRITRGQEPVAVSADLSVAGLFGADGSLVPDPAALRPVGHVEVKGLPTALAALVAPGPGVSGLVQTALGPDMTVTFVSAKAATGDGLDLRAGMESQGLNVRLVAALGVGRLDVGRLEGDLAITPAVVDRVLAVYAPGVSPRPGLQAATKAQFSLSPTRIPLAPGFRPDFDRAGDATVRLTLRDEMVLRGFTPPGDPDPGPAGLRGLEVLATVPLSGALGTGEGPATLSVKGQLAGQSGVAGGQGGDLLVTAKTVLAAGAPRGATEATVLVTKFATPLADTLAGSPGMASGALGPWVTIDAGLNGTFAGSGVTDMTVRAAVTSPRFTTTTPLAATIKDSVLSMNGPVAAAWKVDPAWGTRWLLAQVPADAKTPPAAAISQPIAVTVLLSRLSVPVSGPPMKQGVFGFDVAVDAPTISIASGGATTAFENLKVRAQSGAGSDGKPQEPGTVGLSIRLDAPGGAPGSALSLGGGIYTLADATGNLTTDAAVVTLRGKAEAFPTPVVDAFAKQGGVLIEALGPTLSADLDVTGFALGPAGGGTVIVAVRSPRATFNLRGGIRDGVFRAGAANGQLTEISPGLGAKLVKGLPSLGTFQKQKEDGPAKVNAAGLTLPLDGDMRKLNGNVTLELGVVRFETAGALAKVLKAGGGKQGGIAGRRVDPLTIAMREGVLTYDRYRVPLGEFTLESRGTVDLVRRTVDVVTYVPLGALSEEIAGVFNNGRFLGGKVLESATMMPIRTRGPMDAPTTSPDVRLFFEEAGRSLLSPEGLRELFGGDR
ncbi:MAG: hypothetical protein IT437_03975 [Phycisphaerales bacterium]|nr:hypothetical protein [Phycisphaerales bacterium]